MAIRASDYLKASEVAEILSIDTAEVYQMCASRSLPSIKVGEKSIRVPRAALNAYLTRKEQLSEDERHPLLTAALQDGPLVGNPVELVERESESFRERSGYSPAEFVDLWQAGSIGDTSENASLLIEAFALHEASRRLSQDS